MEINDSIDVLLNPMSIMPCIVDAELAMNSHEELLNEMFDSMDRSTVECKIKHGGDIIWSIIQLKVMRKSNSTLRG